jgi:hypothetical protein
MGRSTMKTHESAAWLYGFLAAVRSGDFYAPPHVVEMVERVLGRWERTKIVDMAESRLRANTRPPG